MAKVVKRTVGKAAVSAAVEPAATGAGDDGEEAARARLVEAVEDINAKVGLAQRLPTEGPIAEIEEAIKAEGNHPKGGFYTTDKLNANTLGVLKSLGVELREGEEKEETVTKKKAATAAAVAGGKKVAAPGSSAAKKKDAAKAVKADRGPGVISSILEFLQAAGKKGITKEDLVAKLAKRFPDKEVKSMGNTVNVQLPSRLSKEKKLKIERNEKGAYFIVG